MTLRSGQESIYGAIQNISLGGALVYSQELPRVGDTLRILIKNSLALAATVVRVDDYTIEGVTALYGVAVRWSMYTSLPTSLRQKLSCIDANAIDSGKPYVHSKKQKPEACPGDSEASEKKRT